MRICSGRKLHFIITFYNFIPVIIVTNDLVIKSTRWPNLPIGLKNPFRETGKEDNFVLIFPPPLGGGRDNNKRANQTVLVPSHGHSAKSGFPRGH